MPKISRSKGNQAMKFLQLIKYIFLEIYTQNVVEKPFPDTLLNRQNWEYLWINSLTIADHLLLPHIKLFKKTNIGLGVSLPHFLQDFWRKMFVWLYSINWSNFIVWFFYFMRYWDIWVLTRLCRHKLWN